MYVILGFVLLLASFVYHFVVPLTPGRLGRESVELFAASGGWRWLVQQVVVPADSWGVAVLLAVLLAVLGVGYATAVYLSWNRTNKIAVWLVLGFAGLFYLLSVVALPNVNTDLFNYMVNGRLTAVYQQNPYFTAADAYPDDPIYPYASRNYTANPEDKLPVWTLLNVLLAWLAGDDPVTNLFVYRSALLLFNLANVGLIATILRRGWPEHLLAGLVVYAWNPIVMLFGQGKTDVVMVFWLLLGVWLWQNGRFLLAPLSLMASVLVKLITAPLLLVYLLGELRTERRWYWVGVGLTAVVVAALAYWQLSAVQQLVAWYVAILWAKDEPFGSVLAQGGLLLLVGGIGLFYATDFTKALHGWGWILVYFALFMARFSFSWYLLTLIAVSALVPNRWLVRVVWLLSLLSLALNMWGAAFTAVFPPPFSS